MAGEDPQEPRDRREIEAAEQERRRLDRPARDDDDSVAAERGRENREEIVREEIVREEMRRHDERLAADED